MRIEGLKRYYCKECGEDACFKIDLKDAYLELCDCCFRVLFNNMKSVIEGKSEGEDT